MYKACDITPKKRPDQNVSYFASGSSRSTLVSSSSSSQGESEREEQNARNNNVVNGKTPDLSFRRFPVESSSQRRLDSCSSPLRSLKSSSSSDSNSTPDRSKVDLSALDSMRLGFSWLQHNQLSAGEVIRSTPRKSQSASNGGIVLNPFENDLIETMQMSSCSPSVFLKVLTPSKIENESGGFSWGVENAALLYPQEFDNIHNQTASMVDQEMEEKLQSAINTYFAQKVVVPSPWIGSDEHRSPAHSDRWIKAERKNVRSQTNLSIPPNFDLCSLLPAHMFQEQESGSPVVDDYEQEMLSLSNPRRKLFMDGEFADESMAATADDTERSSQGFSEEKRSMEPIVPSSPDTFGCDEVVDRCHRLRRATSLSPPKHIKTPTDSPIKLFSADVSMENKTGDSMSSSAQLCETQLLNEHDDEDDDEFLLETSDPSLGGVVSRDAGYHTEPRKSSFSTSLQAQGSSCSSLDGGEETSGGQTDLPPSFSLDPRPLGGDSSWSPLLVSTPSKHTPSPPYHHLQ